MGLHDPTADGITPCILVEGMASWTDGIEAILDAHPTVTLTGPALLIWIERLQHLHGLITH